MISARAGFLGAVIRIIIMSAIEAKSPGDVRVLLGENEAFFLGSER